MVGVETILARYRRGDTTPRLLKNGLGGDVFRITCDGTSRVLKMGASAIIRAERAHYRALATRLSMPHVLEADDQHLLLEYVAGPSFFESLYSIEEYVIRDFDAAWSALTQLWRSTRHNETTYSGARGQQVGLSRYLEERYGDRYRSPLIVNGQRTGRSLSDLVGWLNVGFATIAPFSVTCHGDPRGDNIIRVSDGAVMFIDPRPGYADWVDDATFFSRYRLVVLCRLLSAWRQMSHGVLEVASEVAFPSLVATLEARALEHAQHFAAEVGDRTWRRRWAVAMAASLLREIRATNERIKRGLIGTVPEAYDAFLLAEAVRYAKSVE